MSLRYKFDKVQVLFQKLKTTLFSYDDVIWLVGDGRSGTTWVADIINFDESYRIIFEPFHPTRVSFLKGYCKNYFLPPMHEDEVLKAYYSKVFKGQVYDTWTNREGRGVFRKKLLVKDVFSNLFVDWASLNFKQINIVHLVRNPYAVALSKNKLRDWEWQEDLSLLMSNDFLLDKYLQPFIKIYEEVTRINCFALTQFFLWCVIQLVMINSTNKATRVLVYEEVVDDYRTVFTVLDMPHPIIGRERLDKPSSVSMGFEKKKRIRPENKWTELFGTESFRMTQEMLDAFSLNELYSRTVREYPTS